MTKLKTFSSKVPTMKELYDKYGYTKSLILLLSFVIVVLLLPYIFGFTFISGLIASLLSYVLYAFLALWLIRETKNNKDSKYKTVWYIAFTIGIMIELMSAINLIFAPSFINQVPTNREYQTTTTYVTYSPDCDYCEKSKLQTQRAVAVYNATHWNKVYLVNIDKDTKLTKELRKKLEYKGTIIKNNSKVVYTKGNNNGPIKVPSSEIYEHIKNVN